MNRQAKRNKYKKELTNKNVEINTLKNEVRGYVNAYVETLSDFRKCSRKLEEQEERTEEYKKKYFEQLKKEFLDGNKELVTLSLTVPKLLESYSRIPTEKLEEEQKKVLCYELAKSLYDNFDALRKTEYETSTRFDLVLVKWNQSNRGIDDWDEFCGYANIYSYMDERRGITANELMKGKTRSDNLVCNFGRDLVCTMTQIHHIDVPNVFK